MRKPMHAPKLAGQATLAIALIFGLAGCGDSVYHPGPPPADSVTFPAASTQGWLKQLGTVPTGNNTYTSDTARGVATDFQGNVIVLDQTYGAFSGFTNTNGNSQFAVIKYDSGGNQVWVQQIGSGSSDVPYALTTDTQGNILVGGTTRGAFPSFTNTSGTKQSVVIKLNPSGQVLWTQQFPAPGGTGAPSQVTSLTTDSQSNVIVGGEYKDAYNNLYGYVMKLAGGSGAVTWSQTANTVYDVNSVAADPQGNIFAVGDFAASTSSNSTVYMVAKLDGASGSTIWQQQPVTFARFGAQNLIFTQVAADSQGNALVGGLDASSGYPQCAVAKLAGGSGAQQWQQQFGAAQSCIPGGIATDTAGNVLMTGGTEAPFFSGSNPPATDDMFVAKLDPTGAAVWLQQFGTGNDGARDVSPLNAILFVATDGQNHAYVAGTTAGAFPGFTNANNAFQVFVTQFGQ